MELIEPAADGRAVAIKRSPIMTGVVRVLRVCFAFIASTFAASVTLIVLDALFTRGGRGAGSFAEAFLLINQIIAGYALIPAIVFATVCEIRKITNIVVYLVFSVLTALTPALYLLFGSGSGSGLLLPVLLLLLPFALGCGLVAGYVYWRIAGRYAGGPGLWGES
ncbi:hypothetical protein [Roseibium sp.]|uniref:hypothetical protein n=1 Tax=Roseibium sp. TaxID=1936156 RepID=UPI003BB15EA3